VSSGQDGQRQMRSSGAGYRQPGSGSAGYRSPGVAPHVPPARRVRRRRYRRRRVGAVVVIAVCLGISVGLIVNGQTHHGAPLPASVPENLRLSGLVNGRLTTATAVEGMTSSFPGGPSGDGSGFGPTDATACVQNTGEGWEVDLYGRVGAHDLSLSFDGDNTSSNDMADGYVGTHDIDNSANYGGLVYLYWGSVELPYPLPGSATLVVNPGGSSGTMDVEFSSGSFGGTKVETISGSWRCALWRRLPLIAACLVTVLIAERSEATVAL
jgi:hypothetical protein